jgi:hypothetical protein
MEPILFQRTPSITRTKSNETHYLEQNIDINEMDIEQDYHDIESPIILQKTIANKTMISNPKSQLSTLIFPIQTNLFTSGNHSSPKISKNENEEEEFEEENGETTSETSLLQSIEKYKDIYSKNMIEDILSNKKQMNQWIKQYMKKKETMYKNIGMNQKNGIELSSKMILYISILEYWLEKEKNKNQQFENDHIQYMKENNINIECIHKKTIEIDFYKNKYIECMKKNNELNQQYNYLFLKQNMIDIIKIHSFYHMILYTFFIHFMIHIYGFNTIIKNILFILFITQKYTYHGIIHIFIYMNQIVQFFMEKEMYKYVIVTLACLKLKDIWISFFFEMYSKQKNEVSWTESFFQNYSILKYKKD